jgi:FMN phosphatase YigB (HAD superfamily)
MKIQTIIFDLMGVFLIKEMNPITHQMDYYPVNLNEIIKLLKLCKKNGHQLYVLSNLSLESYEQIKDEPQIASLFSFFDKIMVSGMTPYKKPDPRIFSLFCSTYYVAPQEAIFIDDQNDNCLAAQSIGITRTINCEEFNLIQIAQKLIDFGIISTETEENDE